MKKLEIPEELAHIAFIEFGRMPTNSLQCEVLNERYADNFKYKFVREKWKDVVRSVLESKMTEMRMADNKNVIKLVIKKLLIDTPTKAIAHNMMAEHSLVCVGGAEKVAKMPEVYKLTDEALVEEIAKALCRATNCYWDESESLSEKFREKARSVIKKARKVD